VETRDPDGAQRKRAGNIPLAPQDAEFVLSDYLITSSRMGMFVKIWSFFGWFHNPVRR
jgi:hypothetical protein